MKRWNAPSPMQAKFHGTPVTPESFKEWKRRFDEEMSEVKKRTPQAMGLTGLYIVISQLDRGDICPCCITM